jgi:hypothetical protein
MFEAQLSHAGLELEYEAKEASPDGRTIFVKVHAPWPALSRRVSWYHYFAIRCYLLDLQAEYEKLQMPTMLSDLKPKPKGRKRALIDLLFKKNPFDLQPEYQLKRQVSHRRY